ncbi:MAG: TonB-dependent receptor [Bryobacterales bacterium]|nr:TonB-dependent receptor [Bryobacterales bacterium]
MRLFALFHSLLLLGLAQTPSARVVGRITDGTGAVVPGVTIRVTDLDRNLSQQAASNEVGDYAIPYLDPGRYSLETKIEGFRAYKQAEFFLTVDQTLRIDIPLELGATTESVTVTEAPPVLNTDTGSRGAVISKEEIAEIPLDSRNFSDLAYLTGGVAPKGDGGDGAYAVNGARADNVGFLVDGMNNTQRRNTGAVINPPLEGVQEFKMITSGFAAEYGRYAGGVLSVVTKSGSNRFRGSLYEFLRNDYWDATSYFDVTTSKLRRNQFGATLTGPVRIPKLYNGKDRTFFMVTWESLRLTDGKTQRGIVPQPEMLRGDFTKAVDAFGRSIRITDPLARAPFPNNQIPLSRLNPVSLKLASYYPAPNLTGSANNFIAQGNGTNSYNNFGVKVDHQLTERDRLTLSTFWRPANNWDPVVNSRSPLPIFGLQAQTLDLLAYVKYLRTITPTLFLELNANFSRKTNNQAWPYSEDRDWAAESGFNGGTTNPIAKGLPQVEVSGYIPLGPAYDYPKIWSFNNYEYSGALTWISGKHSFKAGGNFLRMQYFSRQYGDTRGRLTVLGRFSTDPMADFLLGYPQTSRRQLDAAGPYHLISNYAGFFQDDFKVTPSLTLNLGIRYELMKPPQEKFGQWSMFVPSLSKIVIAGRGNVPDFDQRIAATGLANSIIMADAAGLPRTIRKPDYTDFGPRFGFAWRPRSNNNTVLRGGYGLFYGSSSLYRMDEYSDTYPFSINESYSAVTSNPNILTFSDPFPTARRSVGGVANTNGQDVNIQSQYLQSWNLTIERELPGETVLEVAYAGSKGTHLPRRYDYNQYIRDLDYRTQNGTFPRPFPQFGTINIINDGSNSIYNSGSFTVRRRFSKKLFVRATYTYAKALDESSNMGGTIAYNFPTAQDSQNLKGERGRSDFDIGHAFAASFIWSPAFSRNIVARNWQIAGTSTIYSGPPFTPKVANFNYLNGEASRPDRIAKGTVAEPTVDRWFDRTAFPVVPVGSFRFGSSGRNILDGPGTFNINTSLSRRFRFGEGRAFQFRGEAFNVLNHPNFNLPENRVDILSGGAINRAKNNRVLQMALRFEF